MAGLRSQVLLLAALVVARVCLAADSRSLSERAEQKFQHIQKNGQLPRPDSRPTEITETEINAYLASGQVQLPVGVESLRIEGVAGVTTAHCRVDFDRVRAGRANSNPLLRLFSGVHDVVVEAQATGVHHQGTVHVNSVAIDGITVPTFVLQLFVEKYVTPRYPGIGLDSTFALPHKIESAIVGHHKLTVVQR